MCEWVNETRFDRLGIFTYSHEEDTHAYKLNDDVPSEVKQERAENVMDIQQSISATLNQEKVGKEFKVLFDRREGDYYIGRTEHDSPEVDNEVLVETKDTYLRIGDFANVKITRAEEFDLFGTLV
jgi:ribosomal protein S12 methylthiotransferase